VDRRVDRRRGDASHLDASAGSLWRARLDRDVLDPLADVPGRRVATLHVERGLTRRGRGWPPDEDQHEQPMHCEGDEPVRAGERPAAWHRRVRTAYRRLMNQSPWCAARNDRRHQRVIRLAGRKNASDGVARWGRLTARRASGKGHGWNRHGAATKSVRPSLSPPPPARADGAAPCGEHQTERPTIAVGRAVPFLLPLKPALLRLACLGDVCL
jgi:hypothetical protein